MPTMETVSDQRTADNATAQVFCDQWIETVGLLSHNDGHLELMDQTEHYFDLSITEQANVIYELTKRTVTGQILTPDTGRNYTRLLLDFIHQRTM